MRKINVKIFHPNRSLISPYNEKDILRAVSEVMGYHEALILSKVRKRPYAEGKAILAVLLIDLLQWNWHKVRDYVGWANHASVDHAIKMVDDIPNLHYLKEAVINKLNER